MWDGKSGAPLELLAGHSSGVKGAIVLSDGCILSWAHFDTLRLWDGERGAFLKAFGEPLPIDGMLVISDQKLLSWLWSKWNLESSLFMWNLSSQEPMAIIPGHTDGVGGTTLLTDGLVLSWSRDGTLRIWNIKNGLPARSLPGHHDEVTSIQSMTDEYVISTAEDETI